MKLKHLLRSYEECRDSSYNYREMKEALEIEYVRILTSDIVFREWLFNNWSNDEIDIQIRPLGIEVTHIFNHSFELIISFDYDLNPCIKEVLYYDNAKYTSEYIWGTDELPKSIDAMFELTVTDIADEIQSMNSIPSVTYLKDNYKDLYHWIIKTHNEI